jgi:hypothetical protein
MEFSVYTFADEAYVPAIIGLVNSLRHSGFRGAIHVGSDAPLSLAKNPFARAANLHFHVLGPSEYSPVNRKTELLFAHPSPRFAFIDADVVMTNSAFVESLARWTSSAPVFVIEAVLPSIDHRRRRWSERLGVPPNPAAWPSYYFNSGLFAGEFERDEALFRSWHDALRRVLRPPANIYEDPDFLMPDQDVLNAILQDWRGPLMTIGPPDIWQAASPPHPFLQLGSFPLFPPAVLHCTGPDKPWKLREVPPRTPSIYDQHWYRHAVESPGPFRFAPEFPPLLHSWFKGLPAGSMTGRLRRLRRRFAA